MPELVAPDFAFPLRVDASGEFVEVDQNTTDDFKAKAEVLMSYRLNERSDLPEFGTPFLLGHRAPLDLSEVESAFAEWIPEASYRITDSGAVYDPAARRVLIEVDEPPEEE